MKIRIHRGSQQVGVSRGATPVRLLDGLDLPDAVLHPDLQAAVAQVLGDGESDPLDEVAGLEAASQLWAHACQASHDLAGRLSGCSRPERPLRERANRRLPETRHGEDIARPETEVLEALVELENALALALVPFVVHCAAAPPVVDGAARLRLRAGFLAIRSAVEHCRGIASQDFHREVLARIDLAVGASTHPRPRAHRHARGRPLEPTEPRHVPAVLPCGAAREALRRVLAGRHELRTSPPPMPSTTPPLPHLLALLEQATDLKLLRHATSHAMELLREAEALCEGHPELPASLRGLVAYRMGHLTMRDAHDWEALEEAEQCFSRACRLAPALQPWADIYGLAVLGRLVTGFPGAAIVSGVPERLQRRWRLVVEALGRLDPSAAPDADDPILQQGSLNAAEVLAYALGLDLSDLEGLGALERTLHSDADWGFLVGPDLGPGHTRLPWNVLLDALAEVHTAQPDVLAFVLPPRGQPCWLWRPGATSPASLGEQQARLLAEVLAGRPGGWGESPGLAPDPARTAATRRKQLQRTRETLADATGRSAEEVLLRDDIGGLALAPGLALYGAIHGPSWLHP